MTRLVNPAQRHARSRARAPANADLLASRSLPCWLIAKIRFTARPAVALYHYYDYGRGRGFGRALGVGVTLGAGVGVAVGVAIGVGVGVGLGAAGTIA